VLFRETKDVNGIAQVLKIVERKMNFNCHAASARGERVQLAQCATGTLYLGRDFLAHEALDAVKVISRNEPTPWLGPIDPKNWNQA
jgi:hypothetical protein